MDSDSDSGDEATKKQVKELSRLIDGRMNRLMGGWMNICLDEF